MTERMDVLIARQYVSNGETKTAFDRVGVAWPLQNRPGYRLVFHALPVPTMGQDGKLETTVLMMPPRQDGDRQQQPQQRRGSDPDPDSVPF